MTAAVAVIALLASPVQAWAVETHQTLVLTSLPVTYSVSKALTKDTNIVVQNVPEGGRRMSTQQSFFSLQAGRLAEQFRNADAVITIGKLWQEDPLFIAARAANVRIVDIDAAKPWSETLEGVSIALTPVSDAPWAPDGGRAAHAVAIFLVEPLERRAHRGHRCAGLAAACAGGRRSDRNKSRRISAAAARSQA